MLARFIIVKLQKFKNEEKIKISLNTDNLKKYSTLIATLEIRRK